MAEATVVTIEREAALSLVIWCGWKTADKWSNERLAKKLKDVKDVVDGEPDDEDVAETLVAVLKGIEEGSDFEIEGEGPSGKGESKKKEKSKEEVKASEEEKAAKKAEREAAKAEKEKKREEEKAAKKAEREAAKANRYMKNKMYFAGKVVKEFTVDGDREEMVQALNKAYSPPNDNTSRACIRGAIETIQGFLSE